MQNPKVNQLKIATAKNQNKEILEISEKYRDYFDRIVLINLKRRPDRLVNIQEELKNKGWCFGEIELFQGVDGNKVPTPYGWEQGGGAWGCMQSHRQILENAISDDVQKLLVLEDDIRLKSTFISDVNEFLSEVPDNWEQLMLGGQHIDNPIAVKPGIVKCKNCHRTHAYAIRGQFMKDLYARWCSPMSKVHCDWIMGPMQIHYNVYAPDPFIFGQSMSQSDISGRTNPTKFWTSPTGKEPIFILECSSEIVKALRKDHKVHTGYNRDAISDIDIGLLSIMKSKKTSDIGRWINELMWEVVSEEGMVLGVWHPEINKDLIKKFWQGAIYVVKVDTLSQALAIIDKHRKVSLEKKILF
jgi:GR25 family glycosyltransferase involved in LPS biosynthesis